MSLSLARRYQLAGPEQRLEVVGRLTEDEQRQLLVSQPWWWYGRPEQFAPTGQWRWWLINAGRGWGKTRCGAEWIVQKARQFPGCRIALVAMTFKDGRDTMVEGDSGILSVLNPRELRGGSIDTGWNRSHGALFMANGSMMQIFTSEKPRALRGPQHHFVWGDEPAYWQDVSRGTDRDSTFSNMNIGLRLKGKPDWVSYRAQGILTTTPRMVPLLKVPDEIATKTPAKAGLMQRRDTIVTRGTSMDNLHNLEPAYRESVIEPVLGTTLGRQELGGELLEEVEGALWTQEMITSSRGPLPVDVAKTVVAYDPSGGGGAGHDEHGIILASSAGLVGNLHAYIRGDFSGNMTVSHAARQVIRVAIAYGADAIVYEKNQGQDWIPRTIELEFADMVREGEFGPDVKLPTVEYVDAIKNKYQRARPVAALYEGAGHVHHVEPMPVLEGQQTTWIPEETNSPDRLDALVWAVSWLMKVGAMRVGIASPAARERGGRRAGQPNSAMPATYGLRSGR